MIKIKCLKLTKILLIVTSVIVFSIIVAIAIYLNLKISKEFLTISIFNTKGKGSVYVVNTKNKEQSLLVKNQDVMVFGKTLRNFNELIYSTATNNSNWNPFLLNISDKTERQLSYNNDGDYYNSRMVGNLVVSRFSAKSSVTKLSITNIKTKKFIVLDASNKDRDIKCFDVFKNKIIAISYSEKELMEKINESNKKQNGIVEPVEYHFLLIDLNNKNNIKDIGHFKSQYTNSVSINSDGNTALFDLAINKTDKIGVEFLIKQRKFKYLLKNADVKKIRKSVKYYMYPCLNKNMDTLYFVGTKREAKYIKLGNGVVGYPYFVYSYNLKTKKLEKFFNDGNSTITDMNITY